MFYENQPCLVTGGSGFVGTHIVKALLAQGAKVRITVHERPPMIADPGIETIEADLTRTEDCLSAMRGMRFVFHAAGAVAGAGLEAAGAMRGIATNLTLTSRVLEAAWAEKAERVLLFSSSTAYPASETPVRESDLWQGPVHPAYYGYGWMRRYIERLGEFVARDSGVGVAIVRPTAVYGPHDNFDPKTSHVIAALIRRAVERESPFVVWGTGDETRDILHITDLARGCLLALEKKADCDPVNIGRGEGTTIRRLAEIVLGAAGHDVVPVFDPDKPSTIPVRLVDVAKARDEMGFRPTIGLTEGIEETVRWFRKTVA